MGRMPGNSAVLHPNHRASVAAERAQQTHDRGHLDDEAHGVDVAFVLLQHLARAVLRVVVGREDEVDARVEVVRELIAQLAPPPN